MTGLPVLDGWSPGGALWSRGIRFANGPFLDIHNPPPEGPDPEPALLLRGDLREAVALAEQQAWRLKTSLRSQADPAQASPWSLGDFSRGQGALNRLGLIEYEIDPALCESAEYAAPLFALGSAPAAGARLERVWIAAVDADRAVSDLISFGFRRAGPCPSPDAPASARLLAGDQCDVVIVPGGDGVVRLDISGALQSGALKIGGMTVFLSAC